jgi:hypothetical protein
VSSPCRLICRRLTADYWPPARSTSWTGYAWVRSRTWLYNGKSVVPWRGLTNDGYRRMAFLSTL